MHVMSFVHIYDWQKVSHCAVGRSYSPVVPAARACRLWEERQSETRMHVAKDYVSDCGDQQHL